jgi:ABC-type lipoprotein release transport system permease subunit
VIVIASTAGLFLILGLSDGLMAGLGGELGSTLAGDVRFSRGSYEFGEGAMVDGASSVRDEVARKNPSAAFAERFELQVLLQHEGNIEKWRAAFMVGIEPEADASVSDLSTRMVAGDYLVPGPVTEDLITYYPVVAGRDLVTALNATMWDGRATITPKNVINATAGRNVASGSPITVRLVVSGVYSTGLKIIDARAVFVDIGAPRILTGGFPDDDSANVFLAKTSDPDGVARSAAAAGLNATTGRAFAEGNLATVFNAIRVFVGVTGGMLVLLAGAWATHVVSTIVYEDRRTIGYVRALGMGPSDVASTYVLMGGLVGMLGAITGLLAGGIVAFLVDNLGIGLLTLGDLPIRVRLGWEMAALLFFAVAVSSVAAAGFEVRTLKRQNVAEALREP